MANPSIKALGHFISHATSPVRYKVGETKLSETSENYAEKTTDLMENARELALDTIRKPASRPRARRVDRLKDGLKELEILESNTRKAFLDIRRNK